MAVVSSYDRSVVSTAAARVAKPADAGAASVKPSDVVPSRVDTVDLSPAAIAASQAQREISLGLRTDIRADKVAAARAAIARGDYDTDEKKLDVVTDRVLKALSQLKA